jgi:osmotically-inducible protein OsmY
MLSHTVTRALLCLSLLLSGCTSILSATTSEPITMNPGKRTLGAKIDDRQIETVATVNIRKAHKQLAEASVAVHSFNAVVLLIGQVPSPAMKQLAGETVLKINPVRQVHNELEVGTPISLLARSNDTWLTTKVKTKLLASRDVESGRIRVITENNAVYLMGLVSRAEGDKVSRIASRTGGVRKVVKVFEYID